jgi:pyruvate dehydrogenase E1 component alpha subunit
MLLIRRFEESLINLSKSGQSFGHFHVYIGQEATGVPAVDLLEPSDYLFTTHRSHGHLIARGARTDRLMAEILGKATGYSGGKAGTLHLAVRRLNVPVTSAIVGSVLPLATGAAYACQRLGASYVTLCCFGDGAIEEGVFFESMNMAALWKLPVVYLCENNSLGAPGAAAGEYPSSVLATIALTTVVEPFGIPALAVDGTDAFAVHAAVSAAIMRARQGQGPSFVEARVVRSPVSRPLWPELLAGETDMAMAWDDTRMPVDYREWYSEHDGLIRFTRELLASGVATRDVITALDSDVRQEIDRAARFALKSPPPAVDAAFTGVFATNAGGTS